MRNRTATLGVAHTGSRATVGAAIVTRHRCAETSVQRATVPLTSSRPSLWSADRISFRRCSGVSG
ncbi:hypothetical protein [Gordonia iterans]|uniref:hypothetical protein n=1 Tax=Gordonia iterans TaxID=1004901 RepID=UPI001F1E7DF7|nr:hypothetical protein [Gordonia iterans]